MKWVSVMMRNVQIFLVLGQGLVLWSVGGAEM